MSEAALLLPIMEASRELLLVLVSSRVVRSPRRLIGDREGARIPTAAAVANLMSSGGREGAIIILGA